MVSLFKAKIETEVTSSRLVQSLNSPFFPPPIGSEGGWAKSESIITCMRMLRTPPFPPSPQIGGNPYLEVLSRFGLWRDFLNNGRRMSAGSRKVFWKPAVVFAFKQCGLAFSSKSEQLEAIYPVASGKDIFVKAATAMDSAN